MTPLICLYSKSSIWSHDFYDFYCQVESAPQRIVTSHWGASRKWPLHTIVDASLSLSLVKTKLVLVVMTVCWLTRENYPYNHTWASHQLHHRHCEKVWRRRRINRRTRTLRYPGTLPPSPPTEAALSVANQTVLMEKLSVQQSCWWLVSLRSPSGIRHR